MARTCLLHLKLRGLNDSQINSVEELKAVFEKDPLLGYAHENWAYHVHRSLDQENVTDLLKEFLASVKRYPAILPPDEFDHYGPLHFAIEGRIPLSFVPDWANLANTPTQTKQLTPLALATRLGHQEAVEALSAIPGIRGE
jgi:ankyrin repeat domain-containing protein 50